MPVSNFQRPVQALLLYTSLLLVPALVRSEGSCASNTTAAVIAYGKCLGKFAPKYLLSDALCSCPFTYVATLLGVNKTFAPCPQAQAKITHAAAFAAQCSTFEANEKW